jgi:hypothetical protein
VLSGQEFSLQRAPDLDEPEDSFVRIQGPVTVASAQPQTFTDTSVDLDAPRRQHRPGERVLPFFAGISALSK